MHFLIRVIYLRGGSECWACVGLGSCLMLLLGMRGSGRHIHIYIYMHTYIHTYIYIYTHEYEHIYTCFTYILICLGFTLYVYVITTYTDSRRGHGR